MVQFLCTYLTGGRCNSVFYKDLLIAISQLLLHGISQNFRLNLHTARDDIHVISVILTHWGGGVLQLRFFENSSDNCYLASIAWNNTKLNTRYAYYMALHSRCFSTNSSIGGAVMPL